MSEEQDPRLTITHAIESLPDSINDDLLDRIGEQRHGLMALLCEALGHVPRIDHCGMPDHDYCVWCLLKTPGQAPRRT